MPMNELKSPPKKKEEEKSISPLPEDIQNLLYLQRNFPKEKGECHAQYKKLWDLHYRINFYKEDNIEQKVGFQALKMTRSCFVILKKSADGITHIVYRD